MNIASKIAYTLLIIGGLNWGIYGLSGYDLVDVIFGSVPMIARIVYVLVGIAAVYSLINKFVLARCHCESGACTCEVKVNKA